MVTVGDGTSDSDPPKSMTHVRPTESAYSMYSRIERSVSAGVRSPTRASSADCELPGIVPTGFTLTDLLWK